MTSPLLATLTVPVSATVPRRRMGLLELLTQRLCPGEGLPVMDPADISPVRSMFEYDTSSAFRIDDMPIGLD